MGEKVHLWIIYFEKSLMTLECMVPGFKFLYPENNGIKPRKGLLS